MTLVHRRRWSLTLLAFLALTLGLVSFAGPAGASTVTFVGPKLNQYVPNAYPLVALVDHTSQNPNYWHIRDHAFPSWNTPLDRQVGSYPMFRVTDDCSLWPNRVCWELVERNMSSGGSVDGCDWTQYLSPNLLAATCTSPSKVVTVFNTNKRGDASAVRLAAGAHELGHGWGLGHVTDPSYLMYPTADGNPTGPRGDESGCVLQVYNAPPCSSDNTPNVVSPQARSATPPPMVVTPDYVAR